MRIADPFKWTRFGYKTTNGQIVELQRNYFNSQAVYIGLTRNFGQAIRLKAKTENDDVGGVVQEVACTTDGLRLYATNELGWLDAIHLTTGHRESLQFDTMAHGLALSPDGAMVYVGLLHAGAIAVLDRQSLAKVATIATGGRPRRIAFDGSGRRAIIANESGWVDVVH